MSEPSPLLVEAHADAITAELAARKRRRENNARYARDPILWMDDCVWVASRVSAEGEELVVRQTKMEVWPDQRLTVQTWLDLERLEAAGELAFQNTLVDKSRQIGETWLLAALVRWLLLYHQTTGIYMHLKGGEVYDRDLTPLSFFGRVKYIDEHLQERNDLVFRPFSKDPAMIIAPSSGAVVRGEQQTDDPSRGSTVDWVIADEAARIMHGESVHSSFSRSCPNGKLYLSTPFGDSNMHARLCDQRPKGYRYLRLHWSTHPLFGRGAHIAGEDAECGLCLATAAGVEWSATDPRSHRYPGKLTSPWYDQQVLELTDEQVAAELDIDRAGALSARVYPEFERAVHVVEEGIGFDPDLPLDLAWDFGLDTTCVVAIQDHPESVDIVGIYEAGDDHGTSGTPDDVCVGLRVYLAKLGLEGADVDEAKLKHLRCVGDPAEKGRDRVHGRPMIDYYRGHGFKIQTPQVVRIEDSLIPVKMLCLGRPKPLRVCAVNARAFATHMANNVWPSDAQGNRRLSASEPVDNIHNHACRAFAYWAYLTYPPVRRHAARSLRPVQRLLGRTRPRGGSDDVLADVRQLPLLRPPRV